MTMDKVFETVDVTDASIKQFFAEAGTPVGRAFAYAEDKVELLNRVGRALDLIEATSRGDVVLDHVATTYHVVRASPPACGHREHADQGSLRRSA